MRRIWSTMFLICANIFSLDSALRSSQPSLNICPCTLSINIYLHPFRSKAQCTLGMGIEVCLATNCIVAASAGCFKVPTLMQRFLESMRTGPWRGRIRLKIRSVASTKNDRRGVSLTLKLGFDWVFVGDETGRIMESLSLMTLRGVSKGWRRPESHNLV